MTLFAATLWLAQLMPSEPSVVPSLLQPGRAKQLQALPGGRWAIQRPKDAREIGRDEATNTVSIGLPVGRIFCELRLVTVAMPTGHAGSLALSAAMKLKKLPQARLVRARKISPTVVRQSVHWQPLNNPRLARFAVQWFQVKKGWALIAHLEAGAALELPCAGRAQAIVTSAKRLVR